MGTKNNPGSYDCHANAAPDEPLFTLLARDHHAPILLRLWALLRNAEGEDEDKVAEALKAADDMIEWRRKSGRPVPQTVPELAVRANAMYVAATTRTAAHPDDWVYECDCNSCRASD